MGSPEASACENCWDVAHWDNMEYCGWGEHHVCEGCFSSLSDFVKEFKEDEKFILDRLFWFITRDKNGYSDTEVIDENDYPWVVKDMLLFSLSKLKWIWNLGTDFLSSYGINTKDYEKITGIILNFWNNDKLDLFYLEFKCPCCQDELRKKIKKEKKKLNPETKELKQKEIKFKQEWIYSNIEITSNSKLKVWAFNINTRERKYCTGSGISLRDFVFKENIDFKKEVDELLISWNWIDSLADKLKNQLSNKYWVWKSANELSNINSSELFENMNKHYVIKHLDYWVEKNTYKYTSMLLTIEEEESLKIKDFKIDLKKYDSRALNYPDILNNLLKDYCWTIDNLEKEIINKIEEENKKVNSSKKQNIKTYDNESKKSDLFDF